MASFNNNQTDKTALSNSLWAKAEIILSDAGGNQNGNSLYFQDATGAFTPDGVLKNTPYAFSGGPVTLCFNWATSDHSKDGARIEVDCALDHTTESTFDHNLGQNNVAYAITSDTLNDLIRSGSFAFMTINVDFQALNNGFENLYLGAARIDDGFQVPEPGSLALLGLALVGLGFARIRKS